MRESWSHRYYPHVLLGLFIIIWVALAIDPLYRGSWLLEHLLTALFLPVVIWTYFKFRLSNLSYTLLFVFLVLHTIGAHYTYAEVPFGFWLQEVFGFSRNHFDRIAHFSFGLLFAYPFREFFIRVSGARGVWGYWLPVELTLAASAAYELTEMATVAVAHQDVGIAYLGAQGDVWDAQKDVLMATLGSIAAMIGVFIYRWRYDKTHAHELRHSLKVKDPQPLAELPQPRVPIKRRRS